MTSRGEEPARQGRAGLFPGLLRHWRTRRGLSQLDLALVADVSSRHISFLETGRSTPSAEMVRRLAAALDVSLRHTNAMLRAADHPPWYAEPEPLAALPARVQSALDLIEQHHEPFPLFVIDRAYEMVDLNRGALAVLGSGLPGLVDLADLNLARLTLDPAAGGRVVTNHAAVARELLWRMQHEMLDDPSTTRLRALLDDLLAAPDLDPQWREPDPTTPSAPTLELGLKIDGQTWSFLVVISTLRAPLEVSLDELRIEQWFPADPQTARYCPALRDVVRPEQAVAPSG